MISNFFIVRAGLRYTTQLIFAASNVYKQINCRINCYSKFGDFTRQSKAYYSKLFIFTLVNTKINYMIFQEDIFLFSSRMW